ncbi:MAG: TolC family protein, partial [Terriglobia bacterium]
MAIYILDECFEVNLQMLRPLVRTAPYYSRFLWVACLTLFPFFAGAQGQQAGHLTIPYSTGSSPPTNEILGSDRDPKPSVTSVPVTLKQAVQLELRENPQVLIAKIAVSQSDRARAEALAGLLPQADLAAREAIIRFNVQSIIDLPAIGLGQRPLRIGPFQSETGGVLFSQQLLNPGLIRRYQIGRQKVTTARFDESAAREQVTTAVVTQYLSVLEAVANETAVAARVALAQRLFDQAERLEKTGIGTAIDTLRAQVELLNEKQRLIDASTQKSTAVYVLAQLLDLPRREEPQPTDIMRYFELPKFDRQQLISQALANRPEMKALLSSQRQAELSHKAAAEQRLPSLEFSGFYEYQARRLDAGEPGYTYAFTLNVPLWTSGRIHAEIAQTRLELERLSQE